MSTRTRVTVRGAASGFAQEVFARTHKLLSDEPQEIGGSDAGPGPYELLLASLGSCTSMTVAMYARRKAWPLEEVLVELAHEKLPSEAADIGAVTDRIERTLTLVGAPTAEQRERLLEIANKCPVHRTLSGRIEIGTRLV
jgi:uncharacterized OsmC-like protein